MQVTIAEAKAKFAELIRRAESGEDITLTRHGRPVAHLTPAVEPQRASLVGTLKGRIQVADDFDELPEDFISAFTGRGSGG